MERQPMQRDWVKGSLPSWFTTILLAASAYFGQMLIKDTRDDIRSLRAEVQARNERTASLEARHDSLRSDVMRLQQSISDLMVEVRAIRRNTTQ